jgi:hypothetical protein
MATDPHATPPLEGREGHAAVEMPQPTVAPLVLSVGMALLAAGLAFGLAFVIVGAVVLFIGVGMWIEQMLPGRGHGHEPLVEPELRARPVVGMAGTVQHPPGEGPGYRVRMPEAVHPVSAGVKGGLVGGLVLPVPALLWGLWSGHGIWYPVNLLAGMVLPGVGNQSVAELEQFHLSYLVLGLVLHVTMCLVIGLLYGVLMPTLPDIPKPLAWGALLMPILWTAVSYVGMHLVNPVLEKNVAWPWFILSQFFFGVGSALVFMRLHEMPPVKAGLIGGAVGGAVMAIPAMLWGLASGNGVWYPVNLLAAMVMPELGSKPPAELGQFHANWFVAAVCIHGVTSLVFGTAYALVLPKLPAIPGPVSWGGLLMPVIWTGASYSLMGVVNPLLQTKVDWPSFIVAQFIFGLAAAIVVVRSELVYIKPAGPGAPPDGAAPEPAAPASGIQQAQ